ncbi:protein YIF1A [Cyclospora cayetanensis]|uniref:Protein YIF1A n=2 Tax=Cyclospora cayetanensis TaxID=88456 RepID=A0A6P5WFP8_9EIME|nr:protein YIF1A [Cyclospora cayetanensis]OEH78043.1 hrf1 family protein [Cyclospora cayetanensis]
MNAQLRGGGPSQRGTFASRPPSGPMADAPSVGYAQGYVGGAGSSEGPLSAVPGSSWGPNESAEYRPSRDAGRGAFMGGPPGGGAPMGHSYAPAKPSAGVWSSPFGNSGLPGSSEGPSAGAEASAAGFSSAPKGATAEQQVMNLVLHSVADNLTSQAEKHVSMLQQRFPSFLLSLRPYFSVSQGYVFMRLCRLLFPFRALFWGPPSARAFGAVASDISTGTAAGHTPERDLYIPLMALTTFVLLTGIESGLKGGFYPELLGSTLSLSLVLLLAEMGALKLTLYATGASSAAATDILCFCGYKYVHVALLLVLRVSIDLMEGPRFYSVGAPWGNPPVVPAEVDPAAALATEEPPAAIAPRRASLLFISCFAYFSTCAAGELFMLLKRADVAGKDANAAYLQGGSLRGPCASYVIAVAALLQIPLCWFLLPCKVFSA